MTDDKRSPERSFLSRWSQRKLAASRETAAASDPAKPVVAAQAPANPVPAAASPEIAPHAPPERTDPELPPVDSLSFDSDFTPFMKPGVDESIKRQALRKLVTDPRFNVMDGLDVYIDDYTRFEPMTPEVVAQLAHAKFLFDPPKTRVNAQGHVEDVPSESEAANDTREEAQPAGQGMLADDKPETFAAEGRVTAVDTAPVVPDNESAAAPASAVVPSNR